MADDGDVIEEKIVIDYDAIDEATGFRRAELTAWTAFEEAVLKKPEDDRPDVDAWVDEFSEEKKFDKRRVKYVATMGIYAGARDEFNQRTGTGRAHYANGDYYDGDFFQGKKHGDGHYFFRKEGRSEIDKLIEKMKKEDEKKNNGALSADFVSRCATYLKIGTTIVESALELGFDPCYFGDYQEGLREGTGIMKNKDGSIYRGDWHANKRHGNGTFYYVNGDKFSGLWANGLKHGTGTYRFAKGGEYRGHWDQGNFVHGHWIMEDGNYYEGKFDPKKNRPHDDEGYMHFPEKKIVMLGVYKKGRWAPQNEFILSDETPEPTTW